MKKLLLKNGFFAFLLFFCCIVSCYAGKPILTLASEETAQNMPLNSTQVLTFAVKNNVPTAPVALNLGRDRTRLSPGSPLISWEFFDDCSFAGKPHFVPPNGQCNVSLRVRSGNTAGAVSEKVIINFGPTFQTISTAINFSVTGSSVSGFFFTYEPTGQDMLTNSHQNLIWTVQNTTASNVTLNPSGINFTVPSSLISAPVFTNDCSNTVTANGGVCHIQTTIQSLTTPGHVSQYLQVTYNTSSKLVADTPTNFNITSSSTSTRTFSFVNNCDFTVWLGTHGGSGITGCTTDADCDAKPGVQQPGGFTCSNNQCFWKNPVPANGNYALTAKTGTNTVIFPEYLYITSDNQPEVWSGTIAGRTGCGSGACETGTCGETNGGACAVGVGFSYPVLQAEPTLQTNGSSDFYDISSINGLNIPLSIEPVNATIDPTNPFTCGSSGTLQPQVASGGTIGACGWEFSPQTSGSAAANFIWVSSTSGSQLPCPVNACNGAAGEACGLSMANIDSNDSQTKCGKFLGYWTPDGVCSQNSGYSASPYTCNASIGGTNYAGMFGCGAGDFATSCYNGSNLTACCGCINWQLVPGISMPSEQSIVPQCGSTSTTTCGTAGNNSCNSDWITNALPLLSWYKSACPPNYAYPFDDKSSTFTCSNGTSNHVNYRITFCPGGRDGSPPGVVRQ